MDILTIFIFIIVGIIVILAVILALKFLVSSFSNRKRLPPEQITVSLPPLTVPVEPKVGRKPLDENVQFTVFRPRAIDTVGWYQLLAYAHLSERRPGTPKSEPHPQAEVNRKAREALGPQFHGFASLMADSPQAIPQESVLSFVPTIEGIEFVPTHQMILWEGPVHEMIFKMRARSQEMEGQVARGHLRVYLGIILVAEVALAVRVDTQLAREYGEAPPEPEVTVSPYRKIFASYSHKDEPVVVQFEQLVEAFGDKYLRDVRDIRAGEKWNERLEELIREADIFQLFWSSHSMRSPFVRQEWEYALSLSKRNFIRPTFWEEPMPQDEQNKLPPEELVTLQFKRVPISGYKEPEIREEVLPPPPIRHDEGEPPLHATIPASTPPESSTGGGTSGMFDKMFGRGAAAAQASPDEKRFDDLKNKYRTVLYTMNQKDVRLQNLHLENDKLFVRCVVPSEDVKNEIWDQIKLVDASYGDITVDMQVSESQTPEIETYTVKPGDSLWKIAREHYGDGNEYMRVFYANRDKLEHPDAVIRPGEQLNIPVDEIRRDRPRLKEEEERAEFPVSGPSTGPLVPSELQQPLSDPHTTDAPAYMGEDVHTTLQSAAPIGAGYVPPEPPSTRSYTSSVPVPVAKSSKAPLLALLGLAALAVLVAVAIGLFVWYRSGSRQPQPDVPVVNPTPTPVAEASPLSVSSRGFSGPLTNRGERADYNLSLVNNGSAPVRKVKAVINLPEGLEFVRFRFSPNTPRNARRARWNKETRQITWEIGEIAPAASNQSTPMEIFVIVRRVGNVGLVEADKVKTRVAYEGANGKKYEE